MCEKGTAFNFSPENVNSIIHTNRHRFLIFLFRQINAKSRKSAPLADVEALKKMFGRYVLTASYDGACLAPPGGEVSASSSGLRYQAGRSPTTDFKLSYLMGECRKENVHWRLTMIR